MKPAIHAYLCDDTGHRFFGNGPMRLLQLIGETGSLRCAAQQMGLSYSKALVIVKRAEAELGFALTEKTIGGRGGHDGIILPWALHSEGIVEPLRLPDGPFAKSINDFKRK